MAMKEIVEKHLIGIQFYVYQINLIDCLSNFKSSYFPFFSCVTYILQYIIIITREPMQWWIFTEFLLIIADFLYYNNINMDNKEGYGVVEHII